MDGAGVPWTGVCRCSYVRPQVAYGAFDARQPRHGIGHECPVARLVVDSLQQHLARHQILQLHRRARLQKPDLQGHGGVVFLAVVHECDVARLSASWWQAAGIVLICPFLCGQRRRRAQRQGPRNLTQIGAHAVLPCFSTPRQTATLPDQSVQPRRSALTSSDSHLSVVDAAALHSVAPHAFGGAPPLAGDCGAAVVARQTRSGAAGAHCRIAAGLWPQPVGHPCSGQCAAHCSNTWVATREEDKLVGCATGHALNGLPRCTSCLRWRCVSAAAGLAAQGRNTCWQAPGCGQLHCRFILTCSGLAPADACISGAARPAGPAEVAHSRSTGPVQSLCLPATGVGAPAAVLRARSGLHFGVCQAGMVAATEEEDQAQRRQHRAVGQGAL